MQISSEVKNTFLQIQNAVKERETQLLRQIEVLAQHCKLNNSYEKCFKQISVVFDDQLDILLSISKFGRLNFNGLSHDSSFPKIEDYQHPDVDHISLIKCVANENKDCETLNKEEKIKETVEIIEENQHEIKENECEEKKYGYTSNVILECIEKQDPSLCLYEHKKGIILDEDQEQFSSCCSSPNQIKHCDNFNNLKQELQRISNSNSEPNLMCTCNNSVRNCSQEESTNSVSTEELANASDHVRKLSMKQPKQVQQWMKQIISEPETEPAPSNVMEHSQIKDFRKESY